MSDIGGLDSLVGELKLACANARDKIRLLRDARL